MYQSPEHAIEIPARIHPIPRPRGAMYKLIE